MDSNEQDVRQIDAEIAYMRMIIETQTKECDDSECGCMDQPQHILERLQSLRAEMMRGVKNVE